METGIIIGMIIGLIGMVLGVYLSRRRKYECQLEATFKKQLENFKVISGEIVATPEELMTNIKKEGE